MRLHGAERHFVHEQQIVGQFFHGGYALARSGYRYAFWILIAALIFRAMPHITLVSGYMLPFFQLNIWGVLPTTIVVLVAINQPFTLWMLHSFFLSIPKDLDESALVDGCSRFQAFRRVIIPVMWPGVMTRLMACPPTCGSAAAIVCSEAFAKKHGLNTQVRIRAQAMTTDSPATFEAKDMREVVGFSMAKACAEHPPKPIQSP